MVYDYDLMKTDDLDWMLTLEVPPDAFPSADPPTGHLAVTDRGLQLTRSGLTLHMPRLSAAGIADLRADARDSVIVVEIAGEKSIVFYEARMTIEEPAVPTAGAEPRA